MTQHTPAPWTYETDFVSGVYWIYSNFHGEESSALATVHGQDDIPEMDEMECTANAALIAAAPELLEACRDAANQLRTISALLNHIPKKYASQISPTIRYADIDAAIAKAEATK